MDVPHGRTCADRRQERPHGDFFWRARRPSGIRRAKYLNNLVEHDHRAVKRIMLGGIEFVHMLVKGQRRCERETHPSQAWKFLLVGDVTIRNNAVVLTLPSLLQRKR
jgi:hypothetical protein